MPSRITSFLKPVFAKSGDWWCGRCFEMMETRKWEFKSSFSADRDVDESAYGHGNGADIGIEPPTTLRK